MTMTAVSGGWDRPMGYVLQAIEAMAQRNQRRELLDLLSTAAEFYDMGRNAGYEKGLEEATKKGEEECDEDTDADPAR
jgi:flagellar biosynthesis/type III secretory pathway protein FliH